MVDIALRVVLGRYADERLIFTVVGSIPFPVDVQGRTLLCPHTGQVNLHPHIVLTGQISRVLKSILQAKIVSAKHKLRPLWGERIYIFLFRQLIHLPFLCCHSCSTFRSGIVFQLRYTETSGLNS